MHRIERDAASTISERFAPEGKRAKTRRAERAWVPSRRSRGGRRTEGREIYYGYQNYSRYYNKYRLIRATIFDPGGFLPPAATAAFPDFSFTPEATVESAVIRVTAPSFG
jgi:hypothetical protein